MPNYRLVCLVAPINSTVFFLPGCTVFILVIHQFHWLREEGVPAVKMLAVYQGHGQLCLGLFWRLEWAGAATL